MPIAYKTQIKNLPVLHISIKALKLSSPSVTLKPLIKPSCYFTLELTVWCFPLDIRKKALIIHFIRKATINWSLIIALCHYTSMLKNNFEKLIFGSIWGGQGCCRFIYLFIFLGGGS